MEQHPDKWVVIKITKNDASPVYKVFGCWYGGYTGADSWQLNSGIVEVSDAPDCLKFKGTSGSVYSCRKGAYGTSGYGASVLSRMIENVSELATVEVLDEATNFTALNYT